MNVQVEFVQWLEPHFHTPGSPRTGGEAGEPDGTLDEERLFPSALTLAMSRPHVMSVTRERLVESVCSLLERGIGLVLEYNEGHPDFPLPGVGASDGVSSLVTTGLRGSPAVFLE